jgi:hypothetical protein
MDFYYIDENGWLYKKEPNFMFGDWDEYVKTDQTKSKFVRQIITHTFKAHTQNMVDDEWWNLEFKIYEGQIYKITVIEPRDYYDTRKDKH